MNRAKKKIPFRNPRQQLEHPKKFFLQKFKDSFEFSLSFFKKIIFFWYFSFKILLIRDKTSLVLTPKLSQWLIEAIGCRWRGNPVGCHLFKFIPFKHSIIFGNFCVWQLAQRVPLRARIFRIHPARLGYLVWLGNVRLG